MKKPTEVVHAGRSPKLQHGLVNTPVYRGSTVLFPTLEAMQAAVAEPFKGVFYGRYGTPTHHALQEAMNLLESAHGTVLTGSGLSAITTTLQALLTPGDHVLIADCVYEPTRWYASGALRRFGIEASYFDPRLEDLREHLKPNTRLLFLESPGSLSFEVQDIPALSQQAHAARALVVCDNTWATPLYCNPLKLGADVVIHAATKYIVGHADAMLGTISCNEASFERVRNVAAGLGQYASPDDCFLALRGLRSLEARMRVHQANALKIMRWLRARPEVDSVLHPALPQAPGNLVWKRDFSGSSGLFGVVLKDCWQEQLARFCNGLRLFGMGFSWGGYESLLLPVTPPKTRLPDAWPTRGPVLRIHAGLEDADDLIEDLDAAFKRLAA
ncbi:MAG TPA: cystathionine beta-lyase [Solimonas sp.]|nr:cystathionine beta-lyase [Solimonas sp.]